MTSICQNADIVNEEAAQIEDMIKGPKQTQFQIHKKFHNLAPY